MTNHSESTGSSENDGMVGRDARRDVSAERRAHDDQVTLRTPAELADALPYLLGYRPEDSMVLVSLHDRDGRGRFGGRARLGIPAGRDDWEAAARQLAHGLITGSRRRGSRPEQMVAFVCQEPAEGESGRAAMERLRPLAQLLRTECGRLDVPVVEALCISDGRFWSYCCPNEDCCPPGGSPMGLPGTSVLAAAATYAGIQVRGSLRELRARLLPWETAAALEQEIVLDTVGMSLVPRILEDAERADVATETLDLAGRVMSRFAAASPVAGALPSDLRDDGLLAHDEAARLILGLQDRTTRDRAAAWMEGDEAGPALRVWRALARRCVGPYGEHAAAPLTLAGWVAWSTGDDVEAREALAMALGADPDYLFARLLHQACNEGLDPEAIRRCLRGERASRERPASVLRENEEAESATEITAEDGEGVPEWTSYEDEPAWTGDNGESDWTADEAEKVPERLGEADRGVSEGSGVAGEDMTVSTPADQTARRRRRRRTRPGESRPRHGHQGGGSGARQGRSAVRGPKPAVSGPLSPGEGHTHPGAAPASRPAGTRALRTGGARGGSLSSGGGVGVGDEAEEAGREA